MKPVPESCDLVVIGGGINGAAIARDAALRDLKVILFEKSDFGSGASTKTSKLAHGGLRYLKQFAFHLVKDSLHERSLLLKNAPHLVRPLTFALPVYQHSPNFLWQVHLGLYLYDFLGRKGDLPSHKQISTNQIMEDFPGILSQGLKGGCSYCDAQMEDHRVLMENILDAEACGASVYNYAEVTRVSKIGPSFLVHFVDHSKKKEGSLQSKLVINAIGAWSNLLKEMEPEEDFFQVVPSKGVHLVIPQISQRKALLLHAPQDQRVFFVIPWEGQSLVGTTETSYQADLNEVFADEQDVDYLVKALQFYFPDIKLSTTMTFAGLRPLVFQQEISKILSDVRRDHLIHISKSGFISVLGGKYTTHRKIAEDAVDAALRQMKPNNRISSCKTMHRPFPGALDLSAQKSLSEDLEALGLSQTQMDHLLSTYGKLSIHILCFIQESAYERKQICCEHPHIFAELSYAVAKEHVKCLEDWFYRRTAIGYSPCKGLKCLQATAAKLGNLLNWSQGYQEDAIRCFQEGVRKSELDLSNKFH